MLFKKTAVIGHPVGHSLSPTIHNYWIRNLNTNAAEYEKIDVDPKQFNKEIDRLISDGYYGLNVTVPLKELAYKKAQKLSDVSKTTRAVNTLIFKDGNILGTNTDPVGFESTLPKGIVENNIKNKKCLILGAGGSARAIIYTLHKLSAKITVSNRTEYKAENLKKEMKINFSTLKQARINDQLQQFEFIVNTTSLGLSDNEMNNLVDFSKAHKNCFVYDLIYDPRVTNFIKLAQDHGLSAQNGIKMLIGQAAASFYIWHGLNPPINQELLNILGAN